MEQKSFFYDSYTQYKNKVGLSVGDKYIKQLNDVVLVWPFKDCVLEGGQTREEQKRQEIFFNQVLAQDEITQLFEPKVLTHPVYFDAKGQHPDLNFKRNQQGKICQNLIIKGNNLLALHSLKSQFHGQVKLIYIDPPYNTGSDSFQYNDTFSRSSWLTFMKNRAEVARSLLAPSGVFIAQCSFHQYPYLRLLLDEIFNKHLCDLHIQVRHPDRTLTGDKEFNDIIEYVLIYSNDIHRKMPFQQIAKTIDDYDQYVELIDPVPAQILQCANKTVEVYLPEQYQVKTAAASTEGLKKISIRGSIREKNSSGRFFVEFLEPLKAQFPAETLFKVPDMGDDALGYRYFYAAPQGKKNGGYYQGMPQSSDITKKPYPNFFNFEKEYNTVSRQGSVEFRNGKKPEQLMKLLISMFTDQDDLILDYHLGSGTTAATAHKLGRRYIGIEQLQNQIDLALQRLQNVINGDATGISSDPEVNWQGGGTFGYFELKSHNQSFIEQIMAASDSAALFEIWQQMKQKSFLNYQLDIQKQDIYLAEFQALDFLQQQQYLIEILDKNQLYVNLSSLEDQEFVCSLTEKQLSQAFYQLKG
ncbi:hypothetical protein BJI46_03095 [Acinetobacter qingfengensis]|uniref:DNA methylase N-4/N-6 domain-containing protein n=2 Tax=Acinetobacter qingfengensis TaxID=1262585 RepID=A0A1E7R9E7_9GAMM|nr:hypothetical protein BJI46_03095 [Acinetobacter qingfengensis]